jgi:hypothetical protein
MVSNKALAALIVATVVISLGGTILSLNKLDSMRHTQKVGIREFTGLATGQLNLSIGSSASCNVDTNVSFGSGVQPSSTYRLTTDKNNTATTTFQDCLDNSLNQNCKGLQINNTGNVNLNITFSSNANASTLLVSQTNLDISDFMYYIVNGTAAANTSQGCRNITNHTAQIAGMHLYVQESTTEKICENLTYNDGSDTMHIEFNVTLEPDVYPSTKTAIITITCAQN